MSSGTASDVSRSTSHVRRRTLFRCAAIVAVTLSAVQGCRPSECAPPTLCQITKSYHFTITPSEAPPYAREATLYKIVIRDRDSRQPIETGEGQIYASNVDRANTWDGFAKGAELGTYYGKLNYVTAGTWAVAIRFRRDSVSALETTEWMQDVLNERGGSNP
jgi:hypothetical protein